MRRLDGSRHAHLVGHGEAAADPGFRSEIGAPGTMDAHPATTTRGSDSGTNRQRTDPYLMEFPLFTHEARMAAFSFSRRSVASSRIA